MVKRSQTAEPVGGRGLPSYRMAALLHENCPLVGHTSYVGDVAKGTGESRKQKSYGPKIYAALIIICPRLKYNLCHNSFLWHNSYVGGVAKVEG